MNSRNVSALSLSFPVIGGGSLSQSIPGSRRGVVDQLRTDACDELPGIGSHGGGLRRFAEATVAIGHRSFGRRRAQTLSPRESGRTGST